MEKINRSTSTAIILRCLWNRVRKEKSAKWQRNETREKGENGSVWKNVFPRYRMENNRITQTGGTSPNRGAENRLTHCAYNRTAGRM